MVAPRLQRSFDAARPTQELQRGLEDLYRQVQAQALRLAALEPHTPIARGIISTDGSGGASFTGFGFRKVEISGNDVVVTIPTQPSTRYEVYLTTSAADASHTGTAGTKSRSAFRIEATDIRGSGDATSYDLSIQATSWHVLVLPEAP